MNALTIYIATVLGAFAGAVLVTINNTFADITTNHDRLTTRVDELEKQLKEKK